MNLRDNHWPRASGYRQLTTEPKTRESSGFVLNEPINQAILERPLGRSHFITRYWRKPTLQHPLLLIFNRWTLRGQNPP
ncbi:unnamed protein product [Gadus morhua 'NCC']